MLAKVFSAVNKPDNWDAKIENAKAIYARFDIDTSITIAEAVDAFLLNAGFDKSYGGKRSIFHEIGHVVSGSVTGSPRDESAAAIPEHVLMRGSFLNSNVEDEWLVDKKDPVSRAEIFQRAQGYLWEGIRYWEKKLSEEEVSEDKEPENGSKKISQADLMLYDQNPLPSDLKRIYEHSIQAERLFYASTGRFVFQIPEAEFSQLPVSFLGVRMEGQPQSVSDPLKFKRLYHLKIEEMIASLNPDMEMACENEPGRFRVATQRNFV